MNPTAVLPGPLIGAGRGGHPASRRRQYWENSSAERLLYCTDRYEYRDLACYYRHYMDEVGRASSNRCVPSMPVTVVPWYMYLESKWMAARYYKILGGRHSTGLGSGRYITFQMMLSFCHIEAN